MTKSIRPIRILSILQHLATSFTPQTVTDLVQQTQIPRSSLIRLLDQLVQHSYVFQPPNQDTYLIGPNAIQLGFSLINTPHFLVQCQHILSSLVQKIGETCNLTYLDKDRVHYLVRVEDQKPLRLQLHLHAGTRVPLHCTASGKVLLAHLSSYDRAQVTERIELKVFTESTIQDLKALNQALDHTKQQQFGIDNGEFIKGMIALAVPVFDPRSNSCIAALACHAPLAHTKLADLHLHIPALRKASKEITQLLVT